MLLARDHPMKISVSSFNRVAFKLKLHQVLSCFYVPTQASPSPRHACHLSLRLHVVLFPSMPSSHPVDIDILLVLYGKVY